MGNYKQNVENKQDWETVVNDHRLGRKLHYHKFDKDKLTMIFMSDEHLGSKHYNEKEHMKNLEWCLKNEVPLILMGDQLETATKTSVGAGIFEQDEIVQQQLEHCIKIYKPLADKGLILGNHIGNHEARVYNHSGTNLAKILSMMLDIPYLGVGAVHYLKVGKESYTIYTTHGSSGARLAHTKIANTLKLADMIENVDIYAQGHLHQLSHHVKNTYYINKSKRTIEEKRKHFIICGSYLNHWGSYAHVAGYEPARIGSPKVKMSGEEKRIRVSLG